MLLLAFDGLSKKDVDKRYSLKPLRNLDTYTEIDLGDRDAYFTSELFTDLITGYTSNQHGIKGLEKMTAGYRGINPTGFEQWLQYNLQPLFFHTRNFRLGMYKGFLDSNQVKWEKQDIQSQNVFDQYENADQGQVPVYDWRKADVFHHFEKEYDQIKKSDQHIRKEWRYSKDLFWDNFEKQDWSGDERVFYMHHFHFIDWLQHLYREQPDSSDEDWDTYFQKVMGDSWFEVTEFVEEVMERCEEEGIEVMVMSDHGLPERYIGHRPNAFLSTTIPGFVDNPSLQELNAFITRFLEGLDVEKEFTGKSIGEE